MAVGVHAKSPLDAHAYPRGMDTEVLDRLCDVAPEAFGGQGVAFAYLFGSHATGTATARSDVDVAVHLAASPDDRIAAAACLAGVLERASGLGPIEVVVLNDAPLSLAGRVREHGRVIHSTDEVARVRWDSLTARQYHDFRIHEERSAAERLARMSEGG